MKRKRFYLEGSDKAKKELALLNSKITPKTPARHDKAPSYNPFLLVQFRNASKFVKGLPEDFEIIEIANVKRKSESTKRLRFEFDKSAKKDFIKYVAYTYPGDLIVLGMKKSDIAFMKHRGDFPPQWKIFFSIDHVIPLNRGGNNDISNLCILTKSLNNFKESFEEMQFQLYPYAESIKTIAPIKINGEYKVVRFHPPDFKVVF